RPRLRTAWRRWDDTDVTDDNRAVPMSIAEQFLESQRILVANVLRRVQEALQPFVRSLEEFLDTLFSGPLPSDWRERWHDFVAEQAARGFRVEPKSVRELEVWIEAYAKRRGLLPRREATQKSMAAVGVSPPGGVRRDERHLPTPPTRRPANSGGLNPDDYTPA